MNTSLWAAQKRHRSLLRGTCFRLKRAMDVMGASTLIVLLTPVMVGISIAIRCSSRGPVIFAQSRSGIDGQPFTMWKFRTMVEDAEARKGDLVSDSFDGRVFKCKSDPRVTRVGAILRRYSLDELPQLVNVLRGDMSLVGPRPYLPHETAEFSVEERRRLCVLPGITGLGQVSGRADLSWDQALSLDLAYIDRWSPVLDLAICVRTLGAVASGRGAY